MKIQKVTIRNFRSIAAMEELVFSESTKQIAYVKKTEDLFISPKTIEDFLEHLEATPALYSTT